MSEQNDYKEITKTLWHIKQACLMCREFILQKSCPPDIGGLLYIHRGSGEYLENFTLLFISPFLLFYTWKEKNFFPSVRNFSS